MRLALVVAALQAGLGLRLPRFPPTSAGALSSRREVVGAAATLSLGLLVSPRAASASLDPSDLSRFKKALAGVDYLLDNWDKVFAKATDKLPDDVDFEKWIETSEGLSSQISKINELAYTSSFGEYNPGGGKELVRKYLLLTKEQVVLAKGSLETIVSMLKI